jgi:hypothetical protein
MGILDYLVSISEEFAWQARLRVLDQRRILEIFERQRDKEAVFRAQVMLATWSGPMGSPLIGSTPIAQFRVDPRPLISAK